MRLPSRRSSFLFAHASYTLIFPSHGTVNITFIFVEFRTLSPIGLFDGDLSVVTWRREAVCTETELAIFSFEPIASPWVVRISMHCSEKWMPVTLAPVSNFPGFAAFDEESLGFMFHRRTIPLSSPLARTFEDHELHPSAYRLQRSYGMCDYFF